MSEQSEALTRDEILAFKPEMEELIIPEWNNRKVFIRALSGTGRDAFEVATTDIETDPNKLIGFRARIAIWSVCNKNGNLLFTDADAEALGTNSGKALDRIFAAAQKLNKMTEKDIEELEKKSESSQS